MVAEKLRFLIKKVNKTQKEIANELGLTQQRFNFYVTGKREPDNEMVKVLASYFGVSTDYLLGKEQKEKPTIQKDDGLQELLQEPLTQEILSALQKLSPQAQKIALAHLQDLADLERK